MGHYKFSYHLKTKKWHLQKCLTKLLFVVLTIVLVGQNHVATMNISQCTRNERSVHGFLFVSYVLVHGCMCVFAWVCMHVCRSMLKNWIDCRWEDYVLFLSYCCTLRWSSGVLVSREERLLPEHRTLRPPLSQQRQVSFTFYVLGTFAWTQDFLNTVIAETLCAIQVIYFLRIFYFIWACKI